jgi:hypothetical protein
MGEHLKVVQWLSEHGCAYDVTLMTRKAALAGHIDVLDWLLQQQGAQLVAEVMKAAAACGHLRMCQHLRSIGCAWDPLVCAAAALTGSASLLQYLHEHGCPLDIRTCMAAGLGGHSEVLQYVVEHDLMHTQGGVMCTMFHAGARNHLAAVQWLRQHGAPWPIVLRTEYASGTVYQWSG